MSAIASSVVEGVGVESVAKGGLGAWVRGMRVRQVLSIPFWLAAFGFLLAGDIAPLFFPPQLLMQAGRVGQILTVLGVICLMLASRLGASTAAQLQAMQPGRRAILYLRSFKADRNPLTTATDEELLSRIFRTAGPFVAFEEPGERLPEIGSAKMSARNEDWQQVVSDQIQRAQFVVLNMGRTPSFNWEVTRVLELAKPERVLIYFSMHADPGTLFAMYERFVEVAQPLLAHPLPPVAEIGERRFIRFDADGRPELFGSIEKPRTTWRKWVGFTSFGLGLIVLRPIVVERWRQRISSALAPLGPVFDEKVSGTRLWGRLTAATAVYLAGLAALLPMLAWNCWHAGSKRGAAIALSGLALLTFAPVNLYFGFISFVFALIVYLAWPMIMPAVARRHIAFGGPTFGVEAAVVAIAVAFGVTYWLPDGQLRTLFETDWSQVLDSGFQAAHPPAAP